MDRPHILQSPGSLYSWKWVSGFSVALGRCWNTFGNSSFNTRKAHQGLRKKNLVKPFLFILAWLCFSLGIIGAFLPVLPTTPFLLLAAFLFSKSSPRFHTWLLGLPVAGEGIRDWNQRKVIRPRAKILCALTMALSLGSMWAFAKVHIMLKIFSTLLLLSVGLFVFTRKSH